MSDNEENQYDDLICKLADLFVSSHADVSNRIANELGEGYIEQIAEDLKESIIFRLTS